MIERTCDNPPPIGDGANCTDTMNNPSVYESIGAVCNLHDCPSKLPFLCVTFKS